MSRTVGLHYGALAPKPSAQVKLSPQDGEHFDKDADAITRLYLRGFLTEAEAHRARQRLTTSIAAKVME